MDDLLNNPREYNFFQAVRLLQRAWVERLASRSGTHRFRSQLIGYDNTPEFEPVSFSGLTSLNSEAADIVSITQRPSTEQSQEDTQYQLHVSFTGLTGTLGVLPHHYSSLIQTRLRNKDTTLRDFLDLFNHRSISLFYRGWEKYRFPFVQERIQQGAVECLFIRSLYSFCGMGIPPLRNRHQLDDRFFLKYCGHFTAQSRSAKTLENMICEYFEVRAKVIQFCGRWLNLEESSRSRLSSRQNPRGQFCQLGRGLVSGNRVWDIQSKFRIHIGPIDASDLRRYLPGGALIRPICEAAKAYTGSEFTFEVELRVDNATLNPSRLGYGRKRGSQLGRNCWLIGHRKSAGASSVVFQSSAVLE
jgi:type VI secretion system protein ImpH